MLLTWADRMKVEGQRQLLLWMIQQNFPELPEQAVARLQEMADEKELKRLSEGV